MQVWQLTSQHSQAALVLTASVCAVVDGQPESTWHAAAATERLAYHPLLYAHCVRAWLRRNHAVCRNLSSGRCQRTAHEAALGTTVVEHDSRLLRCHLAEDARPGTTLHITELRGEHRCSWPLPQGQAYMIDLGQPFCFNEVDGWLAIKAGGPWESDPGEEGNLGIVLVDIVTGACTSFLLPPQDLDFCAVLEGWSPGLAACLFVQHVHQGQFLLSAYSLAGALVGSLPNPTVCSSMLQRQPGTVPEKQWLWLPTRHCRLVSGSGAFAQASWWTLGCVSAAGCSGAAACSALALVCCCVLLQTGWTCS